MSLPAKRTVQLYYDVISPYAWIAFEQLCRNRAGWNVNVDLKPISLAGVLAGANNHYMVDNQAKFRYMCRDAELLGRYYDVPIRKPTNAHQKLYARGSLPAMRLLTAVNQIQPSMTEDISRALWRRLWSENEDIAHRASLIQAGRDIGMTEHDIIYFMSKIKEKCTTSRLRALTDEAVQRGAFGTPTLVLEDLHNNTHMLFGSDRMHILLMLLGDDSDRSTLSQQLSKLPNTDSEPHKESVAAL